MAEFLLVAPEGWVELNLEQLFGVNPDMTPGNIANWIDTQQISYIADAIAAQGLIPEGKTLTDAKIFDGGNYFAVKFE